MPLNSWGGATSEIQTEFQVQISQLAAMPDTEHVLRTS